MDSVAQALVGVDQDGLPLDGVLAEPQRLWRRQARNREARRLPPRFTAGPAGLKIPRQQMHQRPAPARVRIAGIDSFQRVVYRQRVVKAVQMTKRVRLVGVGGKQARPELGRPLKVRQRVGFTAEPLQQDTEIVVDVGIPGFKCLRLLHRRRLLEALQAVQCEGADLRCFRAVRPQLLGEAKISERLFRFSQLEQRAAASLRRLEIRGIVFERVLKAQHRLLEKIEIDQHVAETPPAFGAVRLELHRFVERLQRFLELSLAAADRPETEEILRLGRLRDRTARPLRGKVILAGLHRQQCHQVQRIAVVRIDNQRALTAHLRVEIAFRFQMPEARFAKCRGGRSVGGRRLGFLGRSRGGPTFATIHMNAFR
jgi:hypothetical protein